MGAEALQLLQCSRPLKGLGVQLHGAVRGKDTRAAASRLLGECGVRGRIGPGKEFGIAGSGGLEQCLPVRLALQYGEAVEVRLDAADQQGVAIVQQVVARDGRGDVGRGGQYVVDGFFGRDVLHDDF